MKRIEMEMLSETPNCPVVSVPGRKFPGVVIQGDSLKNLLNLAEEIEELIKGGDREELADTVVALKSKLDGYVRAYEATMKANDRPLPYGQSDVSKP